jgi:hypothetical protein
MKKILFIALLAASISSCDNLTEGVVRDIELPEHTPVLVGTLFADNLDSTLYAVISQTRGLLDTNASELLEDATINMYKDNVLLHTWNTQDPQSGYYELPLSDTLGADAGTYTFEVLHTNFDPITATDQFPLRPRISGVELNKGVTQVFQSPADEILITLEDIAWVNQHYVLVASIRFTDFNAIGDTSWYPIDLYTDDQRTTQLTGEGLLISENGIDADLALNLAAPIFLAGEQYEYRLTVKSLSEAAHNYYRSISTYQNAQNNPFAEPVVIYSNVDGGYGVFGLSRSLELILE